MPDTIEFKRVQWFSGNSGGGVRSWKLYGVTKVHLEDPSPVSQYAFTPRTLCGIDIDTRPSRVMSLPEGEVCKRCATKADKINGLGLLDHGVVSQEVLDQEVLDK